MPKFQKNENLVWYQLKTKSSSCNVLFLSAYTWDRHLWATIIEDLEKTSGAGNVANIELPGVGESAKSVQDKQSLRPAVLAELVLEFLKISDLDSVYLVAHTWSTPIALSCVLSRPELFSKLILINPFAPKDFLPSERHKKFFETLKNSAQNNEALDGLNDTSLRESLSRVSPWVWTEMLSQISDSLLYSKASQVKIPVSVIHGENDIFFSAEDSKTFAGKFSEGRFELVSQTGHFLPVDSPKIIRSEIGI